MNMRRAGVVAATPGLGLAGIGPMHSAANRAPSRRRHSASGFRTAGRRDRPWPRARRLLWATPCAGDGTACPDVCWRDDPVGYHRRPWSLRATRRGVGRVPHIRESTRVCGPDRPRSRRWRLRKEVDVPAGRITAGVTIRLNPGAAISGRVFDTTGDSAPGVGAELLRERYRERGERRLVPVASTKADDAGYFRVADLLPGRYYVKASMPTPPQSDGDGTSVYVPTYFPKTAWLREAWPPVRSSSGSTSR